MRFSVKTGVFSTDEIDSDFFGANVLLGRDDLDGSFGDKSEYMDVGLLRYPGGGLAEDYFDITNPDATPPTGLSEFLAYCDANGIRPAIVIPTKRYVDDIAAGEADVRAFVEAVTRGDYGPANDVIFEVGNEYYAGATVHGPISAVRYGEIASQFAVAIAEAALTDVTVAVQTGRTMAENARILSAFDTTAETSAVDATIFHQYPWSFDPIESRFEKSAERIAEWTDAGMGGVSFMSEWNIGSTADPSSADTHDYGLSQNIASLEIVYQALRIGVDMAAIWGVQQNNKTALGANEGNGTIYAAGELFRMMAETLPDARGVRSVEDSGDGSVVTYGYETDQEVIVFVGARDIDLSGGPVSVAIDLDGAAAGFLSVAAESLTTNEPINDPRPLPSVSSFTPTLSVVDGELMAEINLTQDYQVVRLIFTKSETVVSDTMQNGGSADDILTSGSGDDTLKGENGDDFLTANDGADILRGGQHEDQLLGGHGNDTLNGGSHDDALVAGNGHDVLRGGSGRDSLYGNNGADELRGGQARDYLDGGNGADTLNGNAGNDRMVGGGGADTFVFTGSWGYDRVQDFALGVDVIDLSAIGSVSDMGDILDAAVNRSGGVELVFGPGTIFLRNIDVADLDADDFLF